MIEHVIDVVTARQPRRQRRCGFCRAVGHDRRMCAERFREAEERAVGMPVGREHEDNTTELQRLRELTATRIREEAVQARAQALQESENRARERASGAAGLRRAQARQLVEQPAFARALEGVAPFDGALQRREVELARQERDRIAWRERGARQALQNAMQGWEEERQEEERLIQGMPEERREVLRQGWEEERQEELRQIQAQPDLARNVRNLPSSGVLTTANEEGLARMVALPVLSEKVFEVDDCPICMETLGKTGKTVMKCGHTVCVSCFLQQMIRATAARREIDCACPVCRVNYIM
jgi:hypothetical protein